MVYAPGHFQQSAQRAKRRPYRSRRERLSVRIAALVTIVLVGLVVFSLTTHQQKTAGGCIDFDYTTMIGGAEMHKCGAQARQLCATPRGGGKSIDADFQTELAAACRKAHLSIGRA